MLMLTLSLGLWQVERLRWKQGLLAEIDRGEAHGPVPLTDHPSAFSRVTASGRFLPSEARYGAEVRTTRTGAAMGARVIAILARDNDTPVVVDRGWAPIDGAFEPPAGTVVVEGYVRPPERAVWSSAADDLPARRFFTLDPEKIAAALGVAHVAPFTLVMLGPPGSTPEPSQVLPRPPNDHLSYAITWFSLSAVLAIVFALFVRQTLRTGGEP